MECYSWDLFAIFHLKHIKIKQKYQNTLEFGRTMAIKIKKCINSVYQWLHAFQVPNFGPESGITLNDTKYLGMDVWNVHLEERFQQK